jgi:hypothetical protein
MKSMEKGLGAGARLCRRPAAATRNVRIAEKFRSTAAGHKLTQPRSEIFQTHFKEISNHAGRISSGTSRGRLNWNPARCRSDAGKLTLEALASGNEFRPEPTEENSTAQPGEFLFLQPVFVPEKTPPPMPREPGPREAKVRSQNWRAIRDRLPTKELTKGKLGIVPHSTKTHPACASSQNPDRKDRHPLSPNTQRMEKTGTDSCGG